MADSSAEAVLNAALILSVTLLWSPDFVSVDFVFYLQAWAEYKSDGIKTLGCARHPGHILDKLVL